MRNLTSLFAALLLMLSFQANAEMVNFDKLPSVSSLAIHLNHKEEYFAAKREGIFVSNDKGMTWSESGKFRLPATMVAEGAGHKLYAFVVAKGLLRFDDKKKQWHQVNNQFGSQVLTQLLTEFGSANYMLVLNQFGKLLVSDDFGKDWHRIQGPYVAKTEIVKRGLALYKKDCQSCHGVDGVGETYTIKALTDKNYIRAPALNDSEHA